MEFIATKIAAFSYLETATNGVDLTELDICVPGTSTDKTVNNPRVFEPDRDTVGKRE